MKKLFTMILVVIVAACVEPIAFDIPDVAFSLVVDGSITDQPGPYRVFLGRAAALQQDFDIRVGVPGAIITLKSDAGEEEVLVETSRGTYETQSMQGVVGRSYWISIVTKDEVIYESEPEKLNPAGELLSISATFEEDIKLVNDLEVNDDRFNLTVNGRGSLANDNYMRWRTTGTYGILTFPHLIDSNVMGVLIPNPPPCSGYALVNFNLTQIRGCECCECWVTANDRSPFVADDALIQNGSFRNVYVGSIPVTGRTFYDKYHVHVQQIAHTKEAYEYFRLIKAQKEGATSLFQPPSGKITGNLHRVGSDEEVLGYFWAGGTTSKSTFITKNMIPYRVPFIDTMRIECFFLPNSTVTRPNYWQ